MYFSYKITNNFGYPKPLSLKPEAWFQLKSETRTRLIAEGEFWNPIDTRKIRTRHSSSDNAMLCILLCI